MSEKRETAKRQKPKQEHTMSVPILITGILIAVFLGGSIFLGVTGSGIAGKEKSKVSKNEISKARAAMTQEQKEEKVLVKGLDEKYQFTQDGASSAKNESKKESAGAESGDYVLPDSDTKLLTDADVSGLSAYDLYLARNEIFARHGRMFENEDLKAYFESKDWYNGTISPQEFDADITSRLSDVEQANIEMIKKYE